MTKVSIPAGRGFDAGIAALAAFSAGFVAFAVPDRVLAALVTSTPLPALIPAAQPPLGDTARLATIGGAALLAFALVWALMALLDRLPDRRSRPAPAPEVGAPRLRRADSHPDAPSRRPLLAGHDLGEPLELDAPVGEPECETESKPAQQAPLSAPLPAVLVAQPSEPDLGTEAEPEAEPEHEPKPEPAVGLELGEKARREPKTIAALAEELPEAVPADGHSLTDLVGRIENGLGRKRQALSRSKVDVPEPDAPAPPEHVGHRLRNAIKDLEKIAARGA